MNFLTKSAFLAFLSLVFALTLGTLAARVLVSLFPAHIHEANPTPALVAVAISLLLSGYTYRAC